MVLTQTLASPYLHNYLSRYLSYFGSLASGDTLLICFTICGSRISWIYMYTNSTLSLAKFSHVYLWIAKQRSLLSFRNGEMSGLVEKGKQKLWLTLNCWYQLHTTCAFAVIPNCFVIFAASWQHLFQFFHCGIFSSAMLSAKDRIWHHWQSFICWCSISISSASSRASEIILR